MLDYDRFHDQRDGERMCYSAVINQDYRYFVKRFGAVIDIHEFVRIYWTRQGDPKIKIPKAMGHAFNTPLTSDEVAIKAMIDQYAAAQSTELEQELFKQVKRLADAERTLAARTTKAALESRRIASDKIERLKGWLADLRRSELQERDSRIYPQHYAPVMVMEAGRLVVKPMRYGCRPAGKPASYDVKFPGTYNARRDNLEGFWKQQFGHTHGITVASAFYENVSLHRKEGRDLREGEEIENVVLEFRPEPRQDMLVACLWSRWTGPDGTELLSFAAITDEPPPEVQAAGHDRCIIPIKPENVGAWLNPNAKDLAAMYSILDDRERPYYEHRMAA